MNNLIRNIFEHYNYVDLGNSDIHLFKSSIMDDFWLVQTGAPEDFNYEKQSELLHQCKKLHLNKALEKNLNLLCLWQVPQIDKGITARLHHLEEDLYFFKKHVLYYTESEINDLQQKLMEVPLTVLLTEKITSPEIFKFYKNNNVGFWQSLLFRLAIKLTFLEIKQEQAGELTELYDRHSEKLKSKPHLALLDEVLHSSNSSTFSDYDEPEELINFINKSMEDLF